LLPPPRRPSACAAARHPASRARPCSETALWRSLSSNSSCTPGCASGVTQSSQTSHFINLPLRSIPAGDGRCRRWTSGVDPRRPRFLSPLQPRIPPGIHRGLSKSIPGPKRITETSPLVQHPSVRQQLRVRLTPSLSTRCYVAGEVRAAPPASCRLRRHALCTSRDGVCVYSRHGSLDGHRIRRNILRLGRRSPVCGFAASGDKEVLRWVSQEPPTAGPVAAPLNRKGFGGPQGRTALVCAPASHCFIASRAYGRLPPPPPPPALTLLVAVALLLAASTSYGA